MKIIDEQLINGVVEQAKQSPRLRMRLAQTKMLPLITYLCSLSQIFCNTRNYPYLCSVKQIKYGTKQGNN